MYPKLHSRPSSGAAKSRRTDRVVAYSVAALLQVGDALGDAIDEVDLSQVDPEVLNAIDDAVLDDDVTGTGTCAGQSGSDSDIPDLLGANQTDGIIKGGQILLTKLGCPTDFAAATAAYDVLIETCTDPMGRAGFGLRQIETVEQVIVAEESPSGYGAPIVYRGSAARESAGKPAKVTVEDGAVTLDLKAGDRLRCDWFNVPKA